MGTMGMNYHPKYSSYVPMLLMALDRVGGDVLEMGTGIVSTHLLHWICFEQGRQLYSYENDMRFYEIAKKCEADFHRVHYAPDWDATDIERPWGVVLLDHAPAIRRKEEARRLARHAQVILLHDSQGRSDRHYHYQEILPLFRYRLGYGKALPQTMAVSNFVDVGKWV